MRIGIEICETASQTLSEKDSQTNWSDLLNIYYEIIDGIKSDQSKNSLNKEAADYFLIKLEKNIDEIIEKMNSYYNLNSVLNILYNIKKQSTKEYKAYIKISLFSVRTFNHIFNSSKSIIKGYVIDLKKPLKNVLLKGNCYEFDKCDYCGKIFNEKDKNLFFFCGHKFHYNCIIFIDRKETCRLCKEIEYSKEDICYKEEENEIKNDEESIDSSENNKIRSSSLSTINEKEKKEKNKKIKLLNEINKKYYEATQIFE